MKFAGRWEDLFIRGGKTEKARKLAELFLILPWGVLRTQNLPVSALFLIDLTRRETLLAFLGRFALKRRYLRPLIGISKTIRAVKPKTMIPARSLTGCSKSCGVLP